MRIIYSTLCVLLLTVCGIEYSFSDDSRVYTNEDLQNYRSGNGYVPRHESYHQPSYQEPNRQPEPRDSRKEEALNHVEERIKELEFKLSSSLLKPGERNSMSSELKELYKQRTNMVY